MKKAVPFVLSGIVLCSLMALASGPKGPADACDAEQAIEKGRHSPLSSEVERLVAKLTQESELVVTGVVTSMEARWNPRNTGIFTYMTVETMEVLRGQVPGRSIEVRNYGGKVGTTAQLAIGAPRFKLGEQVLLFLSPSEEPGIYKITGITVGKFAMARGPEGRKSIVTVPAANAGCACGAGGTSADGPKAHEHCVPLSAVIRSIEAKGGAR